MLKHQLRRVTQFWGLKGGNSKRSGKQSGAQSTNQDREKDGPEGSMADDDLGYSRDEEYVYYMLAPPWVHKRNPILYLMQLPQSEDEEL